MEFNTFVGITIYKKIGLTPALSKREGEASLM